MLHNWHLNCQDVNENYIQCRKIFYFWWKKYVSCNDGIGFINSLCQNSRYRGKKDFFFFSHKGTKHAIYTGVGAERERMNEWMHERGPGREGGRESEHACMPQHSAGNEGRHLPRADLNGVVSTFRSEPTKTAHEALWRLWWLVPGLRESNRTNWIKLVYAGYRAVGGEGKKLAGYIQGPMVKCLPYPPISWQKWCWETHHPLSIFTRQSEF